MENLSKDKLLAAANAITNPVKQQEEIYMLMDALGITYKRTNCGRCLRDYLNIAKEELKIIKNAAEESEFNESDENAIYTYNHPRAVRVRGKVYNKTSSQDDLRELYGLFGSVYVKRG